MAQIELMTTLLPRRNTQLSHQHISATAAAAIPAFSSYFPYSEMGPIH
jgi:hypothetical protein